MLRQITCGIAGTVVALGSIAAVADEDLVKSIASAPVVGDGDVAGRVTDLVITLDASLDPTVPGRALMKGKSIKITLPETFTNNGTLPIKAVFTEGCTPPDLQCNTGVLLQGWPQRPIRPPKDKYELTLEGTHTLVYTALEDLVPAPPDEPGVKQAHLLLMGFTNPPAGQYPVEVVAETGPGGAVESATAMVDIRPTTSPRIAVTNVLFEPPGGCHLPAGKDRTRTAPPI